MKRFAVIILLALALSCTKQALQNTYDQQESKIEAFVKAIQSNNESAYVVYNGGSTRIAVATDGSTKDSLDVGGTVSFYYAGYTLSGTSVSASNMFATNKEDLATSSGWNLSDGNFEIETVKQNDKNLLEGLRNGLLGVKNGGEYYILFSGKYGYGEKVHGTIPAKSALVYHIWVESFSND